jgi:hypothetical protein
MFTAFSNQQAGIIEDSLYLNLDPAYQLGKVITPSTIGSVYTDLSPFANQFLQKSGSITLSATEPAYALFNTANQTGSMLTPISPNFTDSSFFRSSSFTIQAWTYWGAVTGRDYCLFSQGRGAANVGLHIQARNSKLQFAFYLDDLTSSANLPTNTWINIAMVYNKRAGFRKQIYFNGVLDTQGNGANYAGTPLRNNFTIGTNVWAGAGEGGGSSGWDGRLGQTLIYGRDLTASDIFQNYNATKNRYNIV